ncbi:MAG: flagellin [Bacteroidetes bacterium]|nr:flagellin [Bacteroidota bacterium]MCW5895135.1 flagellin [Bacteroidota bacterium]
MPFTGGARINTNIAAMNAVNALNNINRDLGMHQERLATGRRINSSADDPSGYMISKKMEGRIRSMSSAIDNVGDASSTLGVAEGSYQKIADLLVQIKEKQTRFINGAFGSDEKTAIATEIVALASEIDDIVANNKFNGVQLLNGTYSEDFQVGESSAELFNVSFSASVSSASLLGTAAGSITSANIVGLTVDTGIGTVNSAIGAIGASLNRLSAKEENLNNAITNTEAAKSRIYDADIAKEQIKAAKLQILQQTATSMLAQANQAPQVFLSLFRS